MNDDQYKAAVNTFMLEPEALTSDQIDTLMSVDDQLGARALRKRQDASVAAAEARHRMAMDQTLDRKAQRNVDAENMADNTIDHILLALARPKAQIKALERRNDTLEQRCEKLEARLLELEAQRAIDHVGRE